MLPSQKDAVDRNMEELAEALGGNTPVLFSYLELRGVISQADRELAERKDLATDRLISLFRVLKSKDFSWPHLLNYLRENSQSALASRLQNSVRVETVETVETPAKIPKLSAIDVFASRLAQYYQLNYADVPTMGVTAKHVKDVWVTLQMDGKCEEFLATDRIDHTELLSRLKSDQHCNIALIKGDPGTGKTTLAKKIAYDWAISYGSTQQFRLVLAVPLRSAVRSTLFHQLAIDYFSAVGGGQLLKGISKDDLTEEIDQLKSELLVILDGLDEYQSFRKSPFRDMFAAPFQQTSAKRKRHAKHVPPTLVSFKLIITSRPYACESIKRDFAMFRFVILPLDPNNIDEFVLLYCQTSEGVAKVTQYIKTNAELVIQVPLILTFVCYLADSVEEIPTNMTSLYVSLIEQMLMREKREGKLTEMVEIRRWKESHVVKTTSELGFVGCAEMITTDDNKTMLQFNREYMEKSHVTDDSFICGFLLHKFVFVRETLMAEFPHRSIQEFFAALYCYQQVLSGSNNEVGRVVKLICTKECQVGRFFFGIASREKQFGRMTAWLNPSLLSCCHETFKPILAINSFGAILIDCANEDIRTVGQLLYQSVGELEEKMFTSSVFDWNIFALVNLPSTGFSSLSADFKDALHFGVLPKNSDSDNKHGLDWFLADNQKSARLVCAYRTLPRLKRYFDHIDFLIMPMLSNVWQVYGKIKHIPAVKTLITSSLTSRRSSSSTMVIVFVHYGGDLGSLLTKFEFDYANRERDQILFHVEKEKLINLTVDKKMEDRRASRLKIRLYVTVNDIVCQSSLIFSLIRLALLQGDSGTVVNVVDTTNVSQATE